MTSVTIDNVSGDTLPCIVHVCTIFNTECVELGALTSLPQTFELPSQYIYAPVVMLKLSCSECENFEILYCS